MTLKTEYQRIRESRITEQYQKDSADDQIICSAIVC